MPCKRLIHGRIVFWPERCALGKRKILLDATLTPMENLWRIIKAVSLIRLTSMRLQAYTYEDMADLESMVMYATYAKLRRMLADGTYNRKFSLYLNVRAACWGMCQHVVTSWMSELRKRYNLVDGYGNISNSDHGSMTLYDTLSDSNSTRLLTSSEYYSRHVKPVHWSSYARPSDRTSALRKETRKAYDEYCEECILHGINDVIDYNEFVRKNYSDDEQYMIFNDKVPKKLRPGNKNAGRPRSKPTAKEVEAKRAYYRDWYQKNKDRLSALAAQYRAQHRDELQEYHREWYRNKKAK